MTLPVSESSWQATIIEAAQRLGWKVKCNRNVRVQRGDGSTHFTTAVGADGVGFPDLLLVRGARLVIAELKVGRNKPTREQEAWLEAFRRVPGVEVYVWRPEDWDEVEGRLR